MSQEPAEVDHYGAQYGHMQDDVAAEIRREVFGDDIGQNGWQTVDEQDRFIELLALGKGDRLLDIACGGGGPALRIAELTGCEVVGLDLHAGAVANATALAEQRSLSDRASFDVADAGKPLPLDDASFDAIICIDAINHLPDRPAVLAEWARVLKPGGGLLYTDPVVIGAPLSSVELGIRASIGFFLFTTPGANEAWLDEAGFAVTTVEERTQNMADVAKAWFYAREERDEELRGSEGDEAFEGQQAFFPVAHELAVRGALQRWLFVARRG